MQVWFDVQKWIYVIWYIKKLQEESHMIESIDIEKACKKKSNICSCY